MSQEAQGRQGPPGPQLVVMAAGIGKRYGGLKQMEPVGPTGETILDYSIYDALRAGFTKIVFVIRPDIEDVFRERIGRRAEGRADTAYVFQGLDDLPAGFPPPPDREKPWGTGHAILCAAGELSAPFAAINADDFYGARAFAVLGRHLANLPPPAAPEEYCLVGYELARTLSEHGHVARGVCRVMSNGFLAEIVERTVIKRFPDGIKYEEDKGGWTTIPAGSTVSMNFWGFPLSFLERLGDAFRSFLEREAGDPSAEFYLPTVVDTLIRAGTARVRVLPTDEQWFGITYREDAPAVERAVRSRIRRGVYPEKLWD